MVQLYYSKVPIWSYGLWEILRIEPNAKDDSQTQYIIQNTEVSNRTESISKVVFKKVFRKATWFELESKATINTLLNEWGMNEAGEAKVRFKVSDRVVAKREFGLICPRKKRIIL